MPENFSGSFVEAFAEKTLGTILFAVGQECIVDIHCSAGIHEFRSGFIQLRLRPYPAVLSSNPNCPLVYR
jgi:hypothetical protein